MRLSVVIPCYNEAEAVSKVLSQFKQLKHKLLNTDGLKDVELIIVNDGSTDSTVKRIQEFGTSEISDLSESLRILNHPTRMGYGAALKKGFQHCRGDLIAFLDMDSTYDCNDLIGMIELLLSEPVDFVCGDRLSQLQAMPLTRYLGNQIFVFTVTALFRKKINDCCSGMRVFKRQYIKALVNLLPNNLDFTLAMTILLLQFSIPMREIPISYHPRLGKSKVNIFIDGPRFMVTILRFWYRCLFSVPWQQLAQLSLIAQNPSPISRKNNQ